MTARLQLLRVLIIAAATSTIATLFVPIVFVFFLVGGAPQGGTASLWHISPVLSSLTALLVVGLAFVAIRRPDRVLRGHLLSVGIVLLLASLSALVYTFSGFASFGFHPLAVFGILCSGLILVGAAFVARPHDIRGFRFGLRAVIVWLTFVALVCAFVRAATG